MRNCSRRSLLSAIGVSLPFGLGLRSKASEDRTTAAPSLRLRSFEEAVRAAFETESASPSRRVEVGHSDQLLAGVQGCHNDRPFAGFPGGHLRIVRAGFEPGPALNGVRLYVSTVDVVRTGGLALGDSSRPLDFASLPPAPMFC